MNRRAFLGRVASALVAAKLPAVALADIQPVPYPTIPPIPPIFEGEYGIYNGIMFREVRHLADWVDHGAKDHVLIRRIAGEFDDGD